MFSFFQIGALEALPAFVVFNVAVVFVLFKRQATWRWLAVIASVFIVVMISTPADPLSVWLVAAPAFAVLATGVFLSPYLRGPTRTRSLS